MKPSFALNLTEDGITLLHRTSRGWMDAGSVAFGDPDLGAALDYLRSTARGLSPKGITTKLIIPESQILYLQVDAPGPDDISRRAQIELAIDGRTPYALDELVFDWCGSGPTVTVAVVARETLAEAEGFATEHRFNPVSFVAHPVQGFDREPFFGTSTLAPSLLASGEQVEPDSAPLVILAPDATAETMAEPATGATQPDLFQQAAVADVPEPVPPEPVPQPVEPERPEEPLEVPQPDLPEPDLPQPELPEPTPDLPEPPPEPEPEIPGPVEPEPDLPPAPETPIEVPAPQPVYEPFEPQTDPEPAPEPDFPAQDPMPEPVTLTAPSPADVPEVKETTAEDAEAPMAVDVPQEEPDLDPPSRLPGITRVGSVLDTQSPALDDLPPTPSAAALMAFASRRAAEGHPRPLGGADPSPPDMGAARPMAPVASRPAPGARPLVERPVGARPAPKFSYDDPLPPPTRLPGDPPTPQAAVIGKASKGLRSLGNLVTATSIPGTRKKKPAVPTAAPPAAALAKAPAAPGSSTLTASVDASITAASMKAAAQSLSRPKSAVAPDALAKGLSARTMPQRGRPRFLGLILTGILLLMLAIVAAWSSYYLTRSEEDPVSVARVDLNDEALFDAGSPEADEEMLADLQDPGDLTTDLNLNAGALAELDVTAPLADPEQEGAVTEAAATAPLATPVEPAPQTGAQDVAAQASQPAPTSQDEIFLAAMDAPPVLSDPLVLPQPASLGDSPPAAQMPPPPFGTVYQFDENGRIVPTPDGIITPEGVMLFSGKPSVVPPTRPAYAPAPDSASAPVGTEPAAPEDQASAPEAASSAPVVAETELQPAETFGADPSLSAARPRLRPDSLAPVADGEDDASLAPEAESRFASLRPRMRPATILAAGEAARRASEAASLAAEMAAVEAAVASATSASISPTAVAVSRVPAPRPRDLSRAVEAAVAAATRQPETRNRTEPEAVAAAAPAPKAAARSRIVEDDEAEDEPEVANTPAPRIPTKANVAKQATFVNAINLSKINLIGVYGTQSKRYALVRQANGRYRKVSVGDNLDGGRVQAITASEVRYQKGGRMLTLEMPKG